MSGARLAAAALLLAAGAARADEAGPAEATDATGAVSAPWLSGSLRETTAASRNYDQPLIFGPGNRADGFDDVDLRLIASGRPLSSLSFELHGVERLVVSTFPGGAGATGRLFGAADARVPYRITPLSWNWAADGDVTATLLLDRANVKLSTGRLDLTIGRQAIAFGKAYFWNPLDLFLPFGPTTFDRDYKAGVDAVRADLALGTFSGLTAIGVLGRPDTDPGAAGVAGAAGHDRWFESAVLVRGFTTLGDWDLAAQGGKVRGGYHAGAGASGELGPVAVRAETAVFLAADAAPVRSHLTAVAGAGRRFESSLDLEAEYLYNGGTPTDRVAGATLVTGGWLLHTSPHLLAAVASYDLHPLVRGSFAALAATGALSAVLQPGVVCSLSENVDVLAGALLPLGRHPTVSAAGALSFDDELGAYPQVFYLQMKAFF